MGKLTHTVKGPIASFRSADKANIESLKFHFLPKQEGSGDPSPTNIRPITGWTGLNGIKSNKGSFMSQGEIADAYGTETNSSARIRSDFISYDGESQLMFDGKGFESDDCLRAIYWYNSSKEFIFSTMLNKKELPYTYSVPTHSSLAYFRIVVMKNNTTGEISSVGKWLSVNQTLIPLTFPDGQTIYGGYVDPVAGEIVAEYELLEGLWGDWPNLSDQGDGTELRYKKFTNPVYGGSINNHHVDYCNIAKYSYSNNNGKVHYYIVTNSYNCRVYLPSGYDTTQNIQVIGKLLTPIHIPIAPQDIKAFLDHNNFWSDANGDTEVEYAFADRLSERKLIMDTPHIASVYGSVASFNTDLKAPIVDLKAHFTPIQKGSGDASPENIRPITGITKMNIEQTGKNLIDLTQLVSNSVWWNDKRSIGWQNCCTTPMIPVKPGATYYLKRNSNSQDYVSLFDRDGKYVDKIIWSTGGAYKTMPDNVCYVGITIGTAYLDNPAPQLELGSTATAYEEFVAGSEIPIEFPATKNLFKCIESELIVSGWNRYIPNPIKSTGTYTLSSVGTFGGTGTKGAAFAFVDSSYQRIGTAITGYDFGSSKYSRTFTVTDEQASAPYLAILCNSGGLEYSDIVNSIQIETGSTATAFEPYGTIYGGYIDLVRGKVVATKTKLIKKISDMDNGNTYPGWKSAGVRVFAGDGLNTVIYEITNIRSDSGGNYAINTNGVNDIVYLPKSFYGLTQDEWISQYPNLEVELIVPLATPIEYDVAPQILKTLKGTNNIWADTNGNVEVSYWTH